MAYHNNDGHGGRAVVARVFSFGFVLSFSDEPNVVVATRAGPRTNGGGRSVRVGREKNARLRNVRTVFVANRETDDELPSGERGSVE